MVALWAAVAGDKCMYSDKWAGALRRLDYVQEIDRAACVRLYECAEGYGMEKARLVACADACGRWTLLDDGWAVTMAGCVLHRDAEECRGQTLSGYQRTVDRLILACRERKAALLAEVQP